MPKTSSFLTVFCHNPLYMVTEHVPVTLSGVKALKGADREQLIKLQYLVNTTVLHALEHFVQDTLIAFLVNFAKLIAKKETVNEEDHGLTLTDATCILHLQEIELAKNPVKEFKSFANFVPSVIKSINNATSGKANPDDSQSVLVEWNKNLKSAVCAIKAIKNFSVQVFDMLGASEQEASKAVQNALQTSVNTQASGKAMECVKIVEETLAPTPVILTRDRLDAFQASAQEAARLSSVLGSDGQLMRRGLNIMEAALVSKLAFAMDPDAEETETHEFDALKLLWKFMDTDKEGLAKNRTDLSAAFVAMGYKDALGDKLADLIVDLLQTNWATGQDIIESISGELEAIYTNESKTVGPLLVIPDEVANLSDVSEIVKLSEMAKQSPMFPIKATDAVAASCGRIDTALARIKETAKKIGCTQDKIHDPQQLQAFKHECLTWLSLDVAFS